MNFLIRMILSAVAVLIGAYLLPGVQVEGFFTAFLVALILALLNATIRPVLVVLTIPVTFLTLGLFLLVINSAMILLADWFISGFEVNGFWWALLLSIVLTILNSFFSDAKKDKD
ncbi:MAG: phage holin family protein [bacterium]|nr:phage holin family protein [bacterium]